MKKIFAGIVAALIATAAYGQNAGTVTNHAYAIGKGPGVTGYTSLLCASGQLALGSATDPTCRTVSGDATLSATGVLTLATVNANVGIFGSATQAPQITLNGKGLATAATSLTVTPAVGSITGLGAGCATWLGTPSSANLRGCVTDETGTGLLYFQSGDIGTPSAGVGTNLSALNASNLTLGTVAVARGGTNCSVASGTCLDNITGFAANGLEARTGAGTYAARTITGTSGQITVTNGDGVAGNPTLTIGAIPAFSVHKNAVDQTGVADSTFTAVTWPNELYDVGNFFASNGWTPPAGKIHLDCALFLSATVITGNQVQVSVFKNGAGYKSGNWIASSILGGGAASVGFDDIANGSDVYTVQVFIDTTGGTATVSGNTALTFFTGHWISP